MSGTQAFPRRPWAGHYARGWLQSQQELNCVLAMPQPQGHIFSTSSLWFIFHCSSKLLAFAFPSSSFPFPQASQLSHSHFLSSLGHLTDCLDLPWAPLHCSPGHCSLRITTIMITTEGLAQACDPSTQEGARPCSPQKQHVLLSCEFLPQALYYLRNQHISPL